MNRDRVYVEYALEGIAKVRRYTESGRDDFMKNEIAQDAVLRNLRTLAESIQRLSDEVKQTHPEVPWSDISAFRNVIVHDFLGVDLVEVWMFISRDLPTLSEQLRRILTP